MLSHFAKPIFNTLQPAKTAHQPDREVVALSQQVSHTHRADVASLACLTFVTKKLGTNPSDWGSDVKNSLASLQLEFQHTWMSYRNISQAEVDAAVADLERAQATVVYLDSLPV